MHHLCTVCVSFECQLWSICVPVVHQLCTITLPLTNRGGCNMSTIYIHHASPYATIRHHPDCVMHICSNNPVQWSGTVIRYSDPLQTSDTVNSLSKSTNHYTHILREGSQVANGDGLKIHSCRSSRVRIPPLASEFWVIVILENCNY